MLHTVMWHNVLSQCWLSDLLQFDINNYSGINPYIRGLILLVPKMHYVEEYSMSMNTCMDFIFSV